MKDLENSINAIGKWLRRLRESSALYGPEDICYSQAYSGEYKDVSIYDDKGVIIAGEKDNIISGFGRPMVAIGGESFLKDKVSTLLQGKKGALYLDWLEGGEVGAISKLLLQRGAIARPFLTQIIDLTQSDEDLHAGIRKSYTSLINKHLETVKISPPHCIWDLKDLHKEICGRQTRSNHTWKLQEEMIANNKAFLVTIYNGHKMLAGSLFLHNNYSCYYGVSKSTVDSHAIIWKAMAHAKQLRLKTLEMGEQTFGDDKSGGISRYKSGFGGVCKARLLLNWSDNGKANG